MKKPAMTLQEVQQILEDQDRDLQAAYRALNEESAGLPIVSSAQAIARLSEMCRARPTPAPAPKPASGIRC